MSYFEAIPVEANADSSLFWSRTMSLADLISMMSNMDIDVTTSFTTPASKIFNKIESDMGQTIGWCGAENG